ncbi:unnamed protein product [Mytilus coruscus]|uniref:Uncharacterized protein n=1 Tax=Mytilus coruscus TaxID=42192 RepID=A0A6J8ERA8_MYTCO|nr:unnamed protein product [Mytilus coruscus]
MLLMVSAFLLKEAEEASKRPINTLMETDADPDSEASNSLIRRKRDYYYMPVITGFKEMVTLRIMLIFGLVLLTDAPLDNIKQIDKLKKGFLVKVNQDSTILSRKRRHYYGNCLDIKTWYTNDGNGNTVFLDRQSPDCGLTAMRSFHLVRNNAGSHVRYDVSCCNLPLNFKCISETLNTPFNNDGC